MAIRLKKFNFRDGSGIRGVKAIRITEHNILELVNYICKNGGEAEYKVLVDKDGDETNHRIRLRQRNYGHAWGKVDWRIAKVGDYIVRHDFEEGNRFHREAGAVEFERMNYDIFHHYFEPAK